ncbi:LysM peptidoglycan-binding domain-containing protein [Paenibacillus sp. GCM10027628]|uniref:LysM peptidoglycan-binding domain-containing protein n=1 Tax=Paenibacillus sp. GCM10027628 TaxID=3273413 RepID=UPI0036432E14
MKIHIVKKGDSLYELAKKYHVELDQIIALNPQIADPNVLNIGEKVKIPSKPKPVEPPASDYVYKHIVQQGDSLWKLGKAWDVPLQAMIQANPQLKNPNVLMTGEVVYVPKAHDGHEHHHPLPGHHHKVSTAPFVQPPVVQPPALGQIAQPQVSPIAAAPPVPVEMPAPAGEMPSWTMPPVQAAPTVPPAPTVPTMPMMPQAPAMPTMPMMPQAPAMPTMPIMPQAQALPTSPATTTVPAPEAEPIELNEPYPQAVHPFKQFHISATEVFAYPNAEQAETPSYPSFTPYPHLPWEHGHHPVKEGHLPVSNGGCGCGETMIEPPWQAFPTGTPAFTAEEPWQGFPQNMPPMPGFYSQAPMQMASPYDMQQAPCYPMGPELYAPHTGMHHGMHYDMHHGMHHGMHDGMHHGMHPDMNHDMHHDMHHGMHHGMMSPYGMPYPTPYESPILPKVQTHELKEATDTEETVDIDIRSSKKSGKTVRTSSASRKAKSSAAETLNAFLKKQQSEQEKSEPKPNLPWINV